jgi:hypothetical protein
MDLFGLLYLFFRLSPFIVACFFSLISVFNSDLKGFIYLVGLIFSTAITMGSGAVFTYIIPSPSDMASSALSGAKGALSGAIGTLPATLKGTASTVTSAASAVTSAASAVTSTTDKSTATEDIPPVCNTLSLGGFSGFSKVPLSTAVLSYTFFYLVYTIGKNNMALYNIPTLILFPLLILSDIGWNVQNGCYPLLACVMSLIIAGGIGVLWSFIVSEFMPNMQYLIVGSNREMCMKPNDQTLICTED